MKSKCSFEFRLDFKRSFKVGAKPLKIPVSVLCKLKGVVGGSKSPDEAFFVKLCKQKAGKIIVSARNIETSWSH